MLINIVCINLIMQTFNTFWIYLLIWADFSNDVIADDQCLTSADKPGVCSTISDCPSIFNDLTEGKLNHAICRFEKFEQIVCCLRVDTFPTTEPIPISTARISVRKCNEYKEFAYTKAYVNARIGSRPTEIKVPNCPFISVPLIVGGTKAIQGEFPHMALIGYSHENSVHWDCSGLLISEEFILSAAHCVHSESKGPAKFVRLGEHDLSRSDDTAHIDLSVIEIFTHPEYALPSLYNDIALFKVERRIQFNSLIRPACLPEQFDVTMNRAIATGWGNIGATENRSDVLLKVVLDVFSHEECNSNYQINRKLKRGFSNDIQICAGSRNETKDTCRGDSGGPLQIYHKTHNCSYTIVGITSFGKVCGIIGVPGVYTRVYNYLKWIEDIVWPNE